MRARLTFVALAAALLTGGCGSGSSARPAVAQYIKQAERIESALSAPLAAVTQAGAEFAQEQRAGGSAIGRLLDVARERTLLEAWSRIESLRGQLAALRTPAAATHLRALLLELIDLQASATRELAKLIVFVPRFAVALRPLGPATRRLQSVLSEQSAYGSAAVTAAYADKAVALRRFQVSLDEVLGRLHALRPPAVSKPSYAAQITALTGMSNTAGQLARALVNGPQANVQELLVAFDRAALSTQSIAVQKTQIASIRAYNSQSDRLAELSREIDLERLRLADTLR